MATVPGRFTAHPRARAATPPLLVLAVALAYLGIDRWSAEPLPDTVPPAAHAALVAVQAAALVLRARRPFAVLGAVVVLDLVILATSQGDLGVGALAVVVAAYTVVRRDPGRAGRTALVAAAGATAGVGTAAMLLDSRPLLAVLGATVVRVAALYALPAAAAEYVLGRERLARAMREREVQAERTGLARELHDIAGHHLSGIIVGAQAAATLTRTDPDRARAVLDTLQDDARTALADLRRTVGLLRSDGPEDGAGPDAPGPVPSVAALPDLVAAATARGQRVRHTTVGEARPLGPLAETAAYRMVQESLANAGRHAPGAPCEVRVVFAADHVDITVTNDPPPAGPDPTRGAGVPHAGFGIAGMQERADLVGAALTAGPRPDGGWSNELLIALDVPGGRA